MTIAGSRPWLRAFFAGLAQLIFCSTPPAGVLVALGLGVLSPWMLAGAAGGCLLGTVAGRVMPGITREAWLAGLAGFNPAILGIVGAGALAAGQQDAVWLPVLIVACTGLACAISGPFSRFGLYPLSAPAFLIALLTSLALAPAGEHPGRVAAPGQLADQMAADEAGASQHTDFPWFHGYVDL